MKTILTVLILSFLSISIDAKICNCRLPAQSRILNGSTTRGPIPWQVAIRYDQKIVCTGVLVKENWVLTSADCMQDMTNLNILYLIIGNNNLSRYFSDDLYRVKSFKKNMNFSPYRIENGSDIALIELYNPVKLQARKIELACLDLDFTNSQENQTLTATGFGITDEISRNISEAARYAHFKETTGSNRTNIISAKAINENQTICDADQGGPLHQTINGISKVVGLASYTESGFDRRTGDVVYCTEDAYFTKLSSFKLFIESTIGTEYCKA